ncbi:hypothetical protein L0Y65_00785 [Candidatus Micrarchaeota archaeon]|nr:hypothetical protein [Candidatus Micrarchaeota archaeon]
MDRFHAYVTILALAFLLLAGCAQNAPAPPSSQATSAQDGSPDGAAVPPGGNGNETAPSGVANDSAGASDGSGTQAGAPEAKTYSGTFAELDAMGLSLICDVRYTYGDRETSAAVHFGTDSEFRVESPEGVAQCDRTITVIRDTRQYVGCSDKDIIIGCDWFKSSYDRDTPGAASSFDFSTVPASSISCRDWAYDRSMFATGGNICEMD